MNKREQAKYDALRQRIADLMCGAAGEDIDTNDGWLSPDSLSRFMMAVRDVWGIGIKDSPHENKEYLLGCHMLDDYSSIDKATKVLWDHGVRP